MELKNSLYKIVSSDVEKRSFNLQLIPDCKIYRAHFPEQPITPGVCIIQIATELLNELELREHELITVLNANILNVINPTEARDLVYSFNKLSVDEDSRQVKASVVVSEQDKVFSKLSLIYKCKNELR